MKAAVIALILLLVGSLATSGYLLIERKANIQKINDAQDEAEKVRRNNSELTEEKEQAQKNFFSTKSNLTIATNNLAQAQVAQGFIFLSLCVFLLCIPPSLQFSELD